MCGGQVEGRFHSWGDACKTSISALVHVVSVLAIMQACLKIGVFLSRSVVCVLKQKVLCILSSSLTDTKVNTLIQQRDSEHILLICSIGLVIFDGAQFNLAPELRSWIEAEVCVCVLLCLWWRIADGIVSAVSFLLRGVGIVHFFPACQVSVQANNGWRQKMRMEVVE